MKSILASTQIINLHIGPKMPKLAQDFPKIADSSNVNETNHDTKCPKTNQIIVLILGPGNTKPLGGGVGFGGSNLAKCRTKQQCYLQVRVFSVSTLKSDQGIFTL